METATFVADFDETFPGQPPNFALTAVLPSGSFDEPLVAAMEKADMSGDGEIIKYKIRQSKSQAGNGLSLADLLGEVGDGIDLEYCSFFIDSGVGYGAAKCLDPCTEDYECMHIDLCTRCKYVEPVGWACTTKS